MRGSGLGRVRTSNPWGLPFRVPEKRVNSDLLLVTMGAFWSYTAPLLERVPVYLVRSLGRQSRGGSHGTFDLSFARGRPCTLGVTEAVLQVAGVEWV